ncbi:MAG: DUF3540 domain-containing protein [Variovorax sp.]
MQEMKTSITSGPQKAMPGKSRRGARPAAKAAVRSGATTMTAAESCVGIVTAVNPAGCVIQSGALTARARRAASCLLEPSVGDSVACLCIAPDELWVVAVLQREEGVANRLRLVGNTRLEVEGGELALEAPTLRLTSERFDLRSTEAEVTVDSAQIMGRQMRVVASALRLVGATLSTVLERATHFSKNYLRRTEGLDRVHATHLECEAEQLLRLGGEHTLVNGEKLVKARGAQIHFG